MESLKVIPRVQELFDSTCEKQFEAMDCEIATSTGSIWDSIPDNEIVTTFIDATSEELEIRLYLSMSSQFLKQTMPVLDDCDDHAAQFSEDWCMELANRFLGRLKNKLISHRCVLRMGLPRLYRDDLSAIQAGEGKTLLQWQLLATHETDSAIDKEPVACHLVINQINEELHLSDYEDEDEDWFEESELEHL